MYTKVYSDFEIEEMNVLLHGEDIPIETGCIGTCEESLNVKVITKKCKGKVIKQLAKHSGGGEIKITGHMNYEAYCKIHGMNNDKLKDGVQSYGSGSHPNMIVTQKVRDEDGVLKLKAYPNCVVSSAPSRKVDGSTEEVAEVEMTIALANDEHGESMYEEIIVDEKSNEAHVTSWMSGFNYNLIKKDSQ